MNSEYKKLISIISKMNRGEWELLEDFVNNTFDKKASKISLEDSDLEMKFRNYLKIFPKTTRQQFESD